MIMKIAINERWMNVFRFICSTILAGIILELFRPILSASTVVIGQTGNFFVNLFYATAASTSLAGFIAKITSVTAAILLAFAWYKLSEQFSIIRDKAESEAKTPPKDIAKLLKKIKILTIIQVCLVILMAVLFFIYGLLPLTLKNTFDYKLNILQSVISQEQTNKLTARWCLMRSRQDYLRLTNDIKKLESIHKAELEKLSSGE